MEGIHKVVYDYDSRYVSKRNIHKLGQKNQLLNEYLYEDQTYEYKPTFSSNASIRTWETREIWFFVRVCESGRIWKSLNEPESKSSLENIVRDLWFRF